MTSVAAMPQSQLELLRALMELEPKVHIFGGFAEDALLYGRQSRRHEDIDVVVFRDELDLRLDQAEALGFREWHLRMQPEPGRPLVIGSILGEMNLEYVVFDRDQDGGVSFVVPTPEGLTRVWLPEGAFDHARSSVDGVGVRTVSPLALYQIRVGVTETFGGMRPKDKVSQAKLRSTFFSGVPEEKLAPRTELVSREPSEEYDTVRGP